MGTDEKLLVWAGFSARHAAAEFSIADIRRSVPGVTN
jgi:hypothetical protein